CLEQKARLERDAAFEAKADAIRAHEAATQSKSDGSQSQGSGSPTSIQEHNEKSHFGRLHSQPSPRANLTIEEASVALKEYNSKSWVKCVKAVDPSNIKSQQKDEDLQEEFLPIPTTKPS